MKKQNIKHLMYLLHKSKCVMNRRRKNNSASLRGKQKTQRPPRRQSGLLIAPSNFILYSNGGKSAQNDIDEYFDFLNKLRDSKSSHLQIDMSGVKLMIADAALLFKAEVSKLIQTRKTIITAIAPTRDRIVQVLKQTGMDRLLRIKIDATPNREDVVHWRIAEGPRSVVDPSALNSIMADIELVTGMESHPIYQGIIESMANCVEHAYKPHKDAIGDMPEDPGWWVFQQVKDGILNVVVCDLGIGVRRSLPLTLATEQGLYQKLMHITRRVKGSDNRALLAAMEYGRTSTGQKQRGKGMRNAHKVVDDLGEGTFLAMSNTGCYVYTKKPKQPNGEHQTVRLRHSIRGTILGWRLPLRRTLS